MQNQAQGTGTDPQQDSASAGPSTAPPATAAVVVVDPATLRASVATLQADLLKLQQQRQAIEQAAASGAIAPEQLRATLDAVGSVAQTKQRELDRLLLQAQAQGQGQGAAPMPNMAAFAEKLAKIEATASARQSALGGGVGIDVTQAVALAFQGPGAVQNLSDQQQQMLSMQQRKDWQHQNCRVYVGSIHYELGEAEVRQLFAPFGRIERLDMSRDPGTGKHRGYCFITFEHMESANAAVAGLHNIDVLGRPLKVSRPTGSAGGAAAATAPGGAAPPGAGAAVDISAAAAQALRSLQQPPAAGAQAPAAPAPIKVYVGSVPYELDADSLRQIFAPFGGIISCTLLPSQTPEQQQLGKHRGYGFIEFESDEAARNAITGMNGFDISGRKLKVNYASTKDSAMPVMGAAAGSGPLANIAALAAAGQSNSNAAAAAAAAMGLTADAPPLPPLVAAPLPGAVVSNVLLLQGMVTTSEVDEELKSDIEEESNQVTRPVGGRVVSVSIVTLEPANPQGPVAIYVVFNTAAAAEQAQRMLHGRRFGDGVTQASIVPMAMYQQAIGLLG
jgi:poly(U)-binding-splicing factor PUF60